MGRTFGKNPFNLKTLILNSMTKEEKIAILMDWICNLDEEALDALIVDFIEE